MRQFAVKVHRYAGLACAIFLTLVAASGSLLAFNSELEHWFAPHLFAPIGRDVDRLDLATLAERADRLVPGAMVVGVSVAEVDQVSVQFAVRAKPESGYPQDLGFNQFYVNPWTGEELGRRMRGDLRQGLVNVMPFVYLFHFNLMAGDAGLWMLGVVAIVWTVDAFFALYLTMPASSHGFWHRWAAAWRIRRPSRLIRLSFDLHRAFGLWLWLVFLLFAWSSVMFNLRPAYEWVTSSIFDYRSPRQAFVGLPRRSVQRDPIDWRAALRRGQALMTSAAAERGFRVGEPLGLAYLRAFDAFRYEVRGSRDVFERAPKGGSTYVIFAAEDGRLLHLHTPTGMRAGNTVESWLYALHMARVFGRPYQWFVCAVGIALAVVSVTGLHIWWRKRRGRQQIRSPQVRAAQPGQNIQARPRAAAPE